MKSTWVKRLVAITVAMALCGCSGTGDRGSGGGSTGLTVASAWQGYCIATFASDYSVVDDFGDTRFTAHSGQQYLMTQYGDDFGTAKAGLIYDTGSGPWGFDVKAMAANVFPFTSNCTYGNNTDYYAVFNDVSVFSDVNLTTKICDLTKGSVQPRGGAPTGYAIAGALTFTGPTTYQVQLGPFSASCGAAASGYVSVPQVQVFGSGTWLVPLVNIIGPGPTR
ncbi:MAG TPA: hypothetical protein VL137_03195 [Polyangiaceae bacterium]|nr:hypothetical protein [Polyangiaceae bacterium]